MAIEQVYAVNAAASQKNVNFKGASVADEPKKSSSNGAAMVLGLVAVAASVVAGLNIKKVKDLEKTAKAVVDKVDDVAKPLAEAVKSAAQGTKNINNEASKILRQDVIKNGKKIVRDVNKANARNKSESHAITRKMIKNAFADGKVYNRKGKVVADSLEPYSEALKNKETKEVHKFYAKHNPYGA